jgi:hypothetical protein
MVFLSLTAEMGGELGLGRMRRMMERETTRMMVVLVWRMHMERLR